MCALKMTAGARLILRSLVLLLMLFGVGGCAKARSPAYSEALEVLLSQYPIPVRVSPNGEFILTKTRREIDFEVSVLSRGSGQPVANDRSPDTQLSLTWSPDSHSFAFQASAGGNRRYKLYVFDILTKKRRELDAPVTRTAALPLRWEPGQHEDRLFLLQQRNTVDPADRRGRLDPAGQCA